MPAAKPSSRKGKAKGKFTPSSASELNKQRAAQIELPAEAVNTPAPDPEPGDDASNKPGSAPLEVAVNAPGGVPGVTVPKWALWAGGGLVGLSMVVAGVALVRSSR